MNGASWHLLLNHLPMMGAVFGAVILIAGYVLKNSTVKRTALGLLVLAALLAIPAFLTGESAEEVAEKITGITESFIEAHEDLGKTFMIAVCVLGFLSLVTFAADWYKHKLTSLLYGVVLVASIGTSVLAKFVGTSGGEIRHTEIRSDAALQPASESGQGGEEEDDEH